ncbi:MAG TPA: hypothetical protein VFP80_05770, partial [Thermoanaerobaculia bacterium]|nr:hypothetical protein [Thermoanaerobaculia bacterium]
MRQIALIPLFLLLFAGTGKTVINKADELPRRSYRIEGTAAQLLDDRQQLDRLAAELTRNLEADLEAYDIRDD